MLGLAVAFIASSAISAHRLDEYLQATRIALELDAVEIDVDLTPGIAVAESIISLIDVNVDGSLSPDEQRDYARKVTSDLKVSLDGATLPLQFSSVEFSDVQALRRGEGTIRLHARAAHAALSAGAHRLDVENTHEATRGVYLANALVPASRSISVTEQRRDGDQRELTIDYAVAREPAAHPFTWIVVGAAAIAALVKRLHS